MTGTATARLRVEIRPYRETDEPAVLDLLDAALGGGPAGTRPARFFRWKHLYNPFGRSLLLVATHGERVVGLRAFMRWRFRAGSSEFRAVRAVDTATHPEVQGRGVFSQLTQAALDALRGQADLVFNTPNEHSLPGYLKLGWQPVGTVPVRIRARRPLRVVLGARQHRRLDLTPGRPCRLDAPSADDGLAATAPHLPALLSAAAADADGRLTTPRDLDYLTWRYGAAPLLDYRLVAVPADAERPDGVAIFRVRPRGRLWEATVAELLCPADDHRARTALLRTVAHAADVDHLAVHLPPGSAVDRALARRGFLKAPGGITLVTRPLRDGLTPDPARLGSWHLSLGDLEVF